ncbi:Zinc finger SWIM-type [Perkinsela sp. CCAP 1560/4]|nr:Zinc finger SWIM-type [Perkinsela sp. CCAP 1560/4]|eukprot:KNH08599.1 Zinc finger SWIM-type [Perkinsela sp. CCAP 1560/4]
MLTEYAQELYDFERLFAAQFSAHMSSERYGYALSYKSAHAVRYEVDMFEITCSCPYPGQYLIPCRHIIAGALHKRLLHNEWIRRSCSKFLMNDYYNSLRASSVRLVPLQNIQPDGVTVCPERKKFPGQASKLSALCTWRRGQ